jgi:hypothetical protein
MKNLLMSGLVLAGLVGQTIPAFACQAATNTYSPETLQPNTDASYLIAQLQHQVQVLQALQAHLLYMQAIYNHNAPETLYWMNFMYNQQLIRAHWPVRAKPRENSPQRT